MISYQWKKFECEICKTKYPYAFEAKGIKYDLVDIETPAECPYLILESLAMDKNSQRMVYIAKVAADGTNQFRLGRGHESDLRVSDISVSRVHGIIKYIDNKFFLEDNISKFGTLVLVKNKITLEASQTKAIQSGRTVVTFTIRTQDK